MTSTGRSDSPLAEKSQEKEPAKVSKLPLPISDSPLVIDLPDGQKIVVGKMTAGSVIEVATWRGVGRPDSRTSRLMLGVATGNVNDDADVPAAQVQSNPTSPKPHGFAGFVATTKDVITNFNRINWPATFKALLDSLKSKKRSHDKALNNSVAPQDAITPAITVSPVSDDAEIEEWLNRISQQVSRTTSSKSTPKKASTTKKAAPKSSNSRTKRK